MFFSLSENLYEDSNNESGFVGVSGLGYGYGFGSGDGSGNGFGGGGGEGFGSGRGFGDGSGSGDNLTDIGRKRRESVTIRNEKTTRL